MAVEHTKPAAVNPNNSSRAWRYIENFRDGRWTSLAMDIFFDLVAACPSEGERDFLIARGRSVFPYRLRDALDAVDRRIAAQQRAMTMRSS